MEVLRAYTPQSPRRGKAVLCLFPPWSYSHMQGWSVIATNKKPQHGVLGVSLLGAWR